MYGDGSLVYNVHVLIHLPLDVARHEPFDLFSAFGFENYLGQIKRMVKKPTQIISQVPHVLELQSYRDSQPSNGTQLLRRRDRGPLPDDRIYAHAIQYRDMYNKGLYLGLTARNNCVSINSKIALVKNILQHPGKQHPNKLMLPHPHQLLNQVWSN